MNQISELFLGLAGAPALPGARCRGRHHLFDPPAPHEPPAAVEARHNQALGLCRGCASATACQAWLQSLPEPERPPGVTAGQINNPTPTKKAKPQ